MRSTLRWSWPILLLGVVVLAPFGCYVLKPERNLEIAIVDKTVPYRNWLEHRSLFWLLGHFKVVRDSGERYASETDYVGTVPGSEPGDPPLEAHDLSRAAALEADFVYVADAYGVYRDDLESGPEMKAALERSPLIVGGFSPSEVDALEAAVARGRTVIVEFNTMASPTGTAARERLEALLAVRWTRWIGRYFTRLEDEERVPEWLRRNYEREWDEPWRFEGPGFTLLKDDSHVEVLRPGIEYVDRGLTIERVAPVDALLEGARDGVSYPYWFSIVAPTEGARELARYRWSLTDRGRSRLAARGLPVAFPAIVRHAPEGRAETYYFAGDFADNPLPPLETPFAGYLAFKRWFEGVRLAPSESQFFWRFYAPMMERIVDREVERRGRRERSATTEGS